MPIRQSIALSAIAEEAHFHRILVGEDILSREVFTYLSILALRTRGISVATGITSVYVRNLAVLASNVLMLQRVSGNRFDLGLGVGGIPEVQKLIGTAPRRPVEMLRETTFTLQRLLRGETVTSRSDARFGLERFKLHGTDLPQPKIFFGVRGPRLLSLAGEIADGVIFSGSKRHLSDSLRIVNDAAVEIGRPIQNVERILWVPLIGGSESEDLDLARIVVATVIASLPQQEMSQNLGMAQSDEALSLVKAGDYRAAASRISEDVVRDFSFFGSVEEIMGEARKFEGLGFTELVIGPPFGREPAQVLKAIAELSGEIGR